jgi:hypothetical protein
MKKITTEIKWALIFVAMALSWMVFEKLAGFHDVNIDKHPVVTNFIAIPAIAVYVLALLNKRRRDYNGFMSYRQGFVSGLIITAIVTILSPITQVITSLLITPDYFNNAIEYTVSQGLKSREEAEKYFSLGSYIIQGLIGALIMGTITTAIVAIFTIKKPKAAL